MTENILLKVPSREENNELFKGQIAQDDATLTAYALVHNNRLKLLDKQMIEINRRLQLIESKLDNYSDKIYSLEKKLTESIELKDVQLKAIEDFLNDDEMWEQNCRCCRCSRSHRETSFASQKDGSEPLRSFQNKKSVPNEPGIDKKCEKICKE